MVKENGRRFYEETLRGKPLGSPGWRESVRMATRWSGDPKRLNGGGPIWAIFDAEGGEARAVESWIFRGSIRKAGSSSRRIRSRNWRAR